MADWPEGYGEREQYAQWQSEVANGDTVLGFRDWMTDVVNIRVEYNPNVVTIQSIADKIMVTEGVLSVGLSPGT